MVVNKNKLFLFRHSVASRPRIAPLRFALHGLALARSFVQELIFLCIRKRARFSLSFLGQFSSVSRRGCPAPSLRGLFLRGSVSRRNLEFGHTSVCALTSVEPSAPRASCPCAPGSSFILRPPVLLLKTKRHHRHPGFLPPPAGPPLPKPLTPRTPYNRYRIRIGERGASIGLKAWGAPARSTRPGCRWCIWFKVKRLHRTGGRPRRPVISNEPGGMLTGFPVMTGQSGVNDRHRFSSLARYREREFNRSQGLLAFGS